VTLEKESDGRTLSVLFGIQEDPSCSAITDPNNASLGPIVGGSVGGAAFVVLATIGIIFFVRKQKERKNSIELRDKLARSMSDQPTAAPPSTEMNSAGGYAPLASPPASPLDHAQSQPSVLDSGMDTHNAYEMQPMTSEDVFSSNAPLGEAEGYVDENHFTFDEAPLDQVPDDAGYGDETQQYEYDINNN
jgi:hypothetical protein